MKRKIIRISALLALVVWAALDVAAQQLGGATADAKMQNTASAPAGLSGLYSPNLYDGSANINIPIFKYAVDGSDFGISLSYNTKGVKVDEVASDVGLHWNINAGASITRILKDLPDEINLLDGDTNLFFDHMHLNAPIPGYTYPPGSTVLVNEFWAFKGKFTTYFESASSALDRNVYRDTEADDFVVNLPSGTFTFNLGRNNTVFTHPKRNVKVEVLWDGNALTSIGDLQGMGDTYNQNLLGFRIKDEQGITYEFVRSVNKYTTIFDAFGRNSYLTDYSYSTNWVVSKVILATGGKIAYGYEQISYAEYNMPRSKSYSMKQGAVTHRCHVDTSHPQELATELKLKTINYPNSVIVSFDYDLNPRPDYPYGALRTIKVTSGLTSLRYLMRQAFFNVDFNNAEIPYATGIANAPASKSRTLRLKLKAIDVAGGGIVEPYYSFGYVLWMLPERLAPKSDYFGYYTTGGNVLHQTSSPQNFNTTIPFHTIWDFPGNPNFTQVFGLNRISDPISMQSCLLNKVTNAYGGSAEFFYNGHQGLTNVLPGLPTDDMYFGKDMYDGTRLDSIIESEHLRPDNKKVTVFQYSGGQFFLNGGYFHAPQRIAVYTGQPDYMVERIVTSDFLTRHHLINGSNHGYSNVNIITKNAEGLLLGRREIKFSNFMDDTPGSVPKYQKVGTGLDFYTFPYTDKQYIRDWELGLPLEVKEFDQNNRIVSKTINKYVYTLDTISALGKVENKKVALVSTWGDYPPDMSRYDRLKRFEDEYRPYTGAALLDTTIIYKYIADHAFVADTINYTYDERQNVKAIYSRNSKGQTIQTKQAYNYSVSSLPGTTLANMTNAGLEKLIGTERWLLGPMGPNSNKLLDAYYNTFTFGQGLLRPLSLFKVEMEQPLTSAIYTLGPLLSSPFSHAKLAFEDNQIPHFVKASEVLMADEKGNPLETQLLGQSMYTSMLWDTATGEKLAESNARFSDIAYSGFENKVKGNWVFNNAGITNFNGAIAGNCYNSQFGPISRGNFAVGKEYTVAFWANSGASLPTCTIGGVSLTPIAGATKGGWRYYEVRFVPTNTGSQFSLNGAVGTHFDEVRLFPSDAGLQTWSYRPLSGVFATSDVSGRITYFEYDGLGRHVLIRDQDDNILSKTEHHIGQ